MSFKQASRDNLRCLHSPIPLSTSHPPHPNHRDGFPIHRLQHRRGLRIRRGLRPHHMRMSLSKMRPRMEGSHNELMPFFRSANTVFLIKQMNTRFVGLYFLSGFRVSPITVQPQRYSHFFPPSFVIPSCTERQKLRAS